MVTETQKYIDSASALGAFCDKIYCLCPNCGEKAMITAEVQYHIPLWFKNARIQCLNCVFCQDWEKGQLYNTVVGTARQRCPNCGHKWLAAEVHGKANGKLKKSQNVVCLSCQQKVSLNLEWRNEWRSNNPVDPYFGYQLWLQISCCGKTLWAYNEQHLQVLKSYVIASLRDGRNRGKWSMTARLPQWIKSAKNRDAVLKCIENLERRLIE
jgi:hypothetical protein